ncbi:MAG: hypothetical protein ACKO6L_03850 [Flavobacteriales bacterium]
MSDVAKKVTAIIVDKLGVEEHMLGYHMDGNAAGWIAFYEAWKNGKPSHATQTIVDAFSLNQMVEKLIRLLH